MEEDEEIKEKEGFELGIERVIKEFTSISFDVARKRKVTRMVGGRRKARILLSRHHRTLLNKRRMMWMRIKKMPGVFERDVEEAKYEDLKKELPTHLGKAVKKTRERRTAKAAQDVEANPKKSWHRTTDLAEWQGEKACQVPAEIRDVDGSTLTGEREKGEAFMRHYK